MSDWIEYKPSDEDLAQLREAGFPVTGDTVEVVDDFPGLTPRGLFKGSKGKVVAMGRGVRADELFKANVAKAKAEGRELTGDDYEPLIDSEGPVVEFENGQSDWFPGQAEGAIKLAISAKTKEQADEAGVRWYNPECPYTQSHTTEFCGRGCGTKAERGE